MIESEGSLPIVWLIPLKKERKVQRYLRKRRRGLPPSFKERLMDRSVQANGHI